MKTSKNYNRLFHFICLCITVVLIGKCIEKSLRDEDDTSVQYRQFNTDEGTIYPSISFCVAHPYHLFYGPKVWHQYSDKNESTMTKKDAKTLRNDYLDFLRGKFDNERMHEVNYDQISTNLGEHLRSFKIELESNEQIVYEIANGSFIVKEVFREVKIGKNLKKSNESIPLTINLHAINNPNLYISKRKTHQKCFSFDTPFIPKRQIKRLTLHFKKSLLREQGNRPDQKQFSVHYHYPHQTMKSISMLEQKFGKSEKKVDKYMKRFFVASVEVIRRRNKRSAPCIEGWYDDVILKSAMRASGCKSSVIITNDSYPICNTTQSFLEFNMAWKVKEYPPPCESIQGLYEWHGEGDKAAIRKFCHRYGNTCENSDLIVEIIFTNEFYKEIVYSKKYTFETLIGNTGGYVGTLKFERLLNLARRNRIP